MSPRGGHTEGRGRYRPLMHSAATDPALPGNELVRHGLDDLAAGRETIEALLVSIGARRLRALGIEVPPAFPEPEDRLFALLEVDDPLEAHGRYNALVRTLVSFERAAESLA